jgi:galactokinase
LYVDATGSIGLEDNHQLADVMAFSSCKGLFGLTGAGFGGCVAALVHPQAKAEFEKHVCETYKQQTDIQTSVQWFSPSGGVREITN